MTDATEIGTEAEEPQFDHHSLEHAADPVCSFRALRQDGGVTHIDKYGEYYVLSRYADIVAAARSHTIFSSDRNTGGPDYGGVSIPRHPATRLSLDELDPPEWKRIRSTMNPVLSPAAVDRMRPGIHALITSMIDRFIESGRADLVLDFANPVPAIVTLDLIGIPRDDWERYADPIHRMVFTRRDHAEYEEVFDGTVWILDRLRELIGLRRREPAEDLVTYLVQREANGSPLTDEEILELLFLTLGGGVDTTTALLASTLHYLSEHPDDRQRLQNDPPLIDLACEEFLRIFTPVQSLARTVTEDVTVNEVDLHAGDRVLLAWASANRDEEQFEDPDEVRLDRFPNRHCAFSMGIHRCVGSNLARAEYKFAVGEILRRIPDYKVVPGGCAPLPAGRERQWLGADARHVHAWHT
jgi:cytochrome P450